MTKNVLKYKGYLAKIEIDFEDNILHGRIEGISDMITFEGKTPEECEKDFQEAVDEYIAFCKEVGKAPDKAYTGTFNVRIDKNLHKRLAMRALEEDVSQNKLIEKAVQQFLDNNEENNRWEEVSVIKKDKDRTWRKDGRALVLQMPGTTSRPYMI